VANAHVTPLGDTPVRGVAVWLRAATPRTGAPRVSLRAKAVY